MVTIRERIDGFINKTFYNLGYFVATHKGYFIILPILITIIFGTGLQQLNYEDKPENLFAAPGSRSAADKIVIDKYFDLKKNDTKEYKTKTGEPMYVAVTVLPKDGGTIFKEDFWAELWKFNAFAENSSVYSNGKEYKYKSDLCKKDKGACKTNTILKLGNLLPEFNNGSLILTYPFTLDPVDFDVYFFPKFIGGIGVSEDGLVESASAIRWVYELKTDFRTEDELQIGKDWEDMMIDYAINTEFEHLDVSVLTSRSLVNELERNISTLAPYMASAIVIMMMFCMVTVTTGDCVRGKFWLGLAGIFCSIMAIVAGFGLLCYIGIDFIGINMIAPFLLLGIGIDDTFVMLAAWRRTRLQDPVPKRLAETYADAAISVTITSITDMLSFYIGILTPFPSVQIFCSYTGTAVIITYLWQITFFGAFLALSGEGEKNQRHYLTGQKVLPVSESIDKTPFYRLCCAGGISESDPDNELDNEEHTLMAFFRDYVAYFLNMPISKVFVGFMYLIYIAGAIYGCYNLVEGLERRKLVRYDSYVDKFFRIDDVYFQDFAFPISLVITGDVEYGNLTTQREIEELLEKMESHTHMADAIYNTVWLRGWKSFMEYAEEEFNIKYNNEAEYIGYLKKHDYLGPGHRTYSKDITLNEDGTKIIATRFSLQSYNLYNSEVTKHLISDLRKIADDSKFDAMIYSHMLIFFDQLTFIKSTTIETISIAAGVMVLVALLLIPNAICSIWIGFAIISIEIGVVGYMSMWDVNLDSISVIILIMSIGFSVDFSAHISYAYLSSKADTPEGRVRECLHSLGFPIMQVAISTIVGILPLTFHPAYISNTFFKTVFLVMFLGVTHGMFLLPVILSFFGTGSITDRKSRKLNTNSNLEISSPSTHFSYTPKDDVMHPGPDQMVIPRPKYLNRGFDMSSER